MKYDDTDKIDTIGQKLGVEHLDIKQTRRQKARKIAYRLIQGVIALGSTLLGGGFGAVSSGYPFDNSYWVNFGRGIFVETVVNAGNGLFLFPNGQSLGFTRAQRLKIYLGNIILSVALFLISFGIGSRWWGTTGSIRYNNYDNNAFMRKLGQMNG